MNSNMKSLLSFFSDNEPPVNKNATMGKPITRLPPPPTLVIPLRQHIGAPAEPVVEAGAKVKRGQLLARAAGPVSANIHGPAGGTVIQIEPRTGPAGAPIRSIVMAVDEHADQTWEDGPLEIDPETIDSEDIRTKVEAAGVVGLGGAAFPTHVKLAKRPKYPVDNVIINGCECEPFLTCDHRLMLERPNDVIMGARLIAAAVGAKKIIIAVEDDKHDAAEVLTHETRDFDNITVLELPRKFPLGAERILIHESLGIKVEPRKLPFEAGVVVQNVSTAISVLEAVAIGKPLIERVITVSGDLVRNPKNLLVPIGTPVGEILKHCETDLDGFFRLILGGPMTGVAQNDLNVPVVKGTNGVLAISGVPISRHLPCVRCARCVSLCPMNLLPSACGIACEKQEWSEAEKLSATDCLECGACAFACPSKRPQIKWIKQAKVEIARKKEKTGSKS